LTLGKATGCAVFLQKSGFFLNLKFLFWTMHELSILTADKDSAV